MPNNIEGFTASLARSLDLKIIIEKDLERVCQTEAKINKNIDMASKEWRKYTIWRKDI